MSDPTAVTGAQVRADACTTEGMRKRHYARDWRDRRDYGVGRYGLTFCGQGARDQEWVDHRMRIRHGGKPLRIDDLPPCKLCERAVAKEVQP